MRTPTSLTVVLPAYGVGAAIISVVRDLAVAAYAFRARGQRMDVLLLHQGAADVADACVRLADELGLPLRLGVAPPSGAGAAFLAGFQRVLEEDRADLVVTLDANGRHDATQIPRLVDQLVAEDVDVVIGSRWVAGSGTPGLGLSRWVLGRLANILVRLLTQTHGIADATTSFRVARAEVLRSFVFKGVPVSSHSVQTAFVAMAVANGYRVREGPIIYRLPAGPGGGLQVQDVAAFAAHLVALRRQVVRLRQDRLAAPGRAFTERYFGAAQDLERLSTALHFFDWVLDEFDAFLRGHVLEVGAGLGTITRRLVERHPIVSIVALEPAQNVYADLAAFAALEPRVSAYQQTLEQYQPRPGVEFDAVVYLNVLEHIDDDAGELRRAAAVLRTGGALLVFGPALGWLYSELDYKAGHYRRYSVAQLRQLVAAAGLQVVSIHYFDVLGVLPYFVVYRLWGHDTVAGSTLWWYDRVVVPLSRGLQRMWPNPPLGKNVILIARKP
jgi:2-polyprenyl-3-methyl-5-hydroxy-6-metoxy-1,4-benzoquinol methylase